MKHACFLLTLAAALLTPPSLAAQPTQPDAAAEEARLQRIAEQLHPQTGDVRITAANATLRLGEEYYFLPAEEARLVLTEGWGNPAEATTAVLGMVFPSGRTFTDDTWGAVITYEASGYVNDSDAESTDYAALLEEMRSGEEAENAERAQLGYPAVHLVGWAQTPVYDRATHSVVWARNIRFEGEGENTLNYDIRLLGRRGVLSLNMVTVMSKLPDTREAARRFAASAAFVPGEQYADFREGDQVAEYGVAGLIAAGVGATIAKKAGLLALLIAFGKKAFVFVLFGLALAWGFIRRLFSRGRDQGEFQSAPEAYAYEATPAEPTPEDDAVEAYPGAIAPPPTS